jgi:hypothetical protein
MLDPNAPGKWGPQNGVTALGQANDIPVTGQWDGKATGLGIFRDGMWLLDYKRKRRLERPRRR